MRVAQLQLEQDKHKHRQADKKHQMGSELIAIYSKKVRKIKITQKWRITDQMEDVSLDDTTGHMI